MTTTVATDLVDRAARPGARSSRPKPTPPRRPAPVGTGGRRGAPAGLFRTWCPASWAGPRPTWPPPWPCSRSWPGPTARPAGRSWPTPPPPASPPSTPVTRRWRPSSAPSTGRRRPPPARCWPACSDPWARPSGSTTASRCRATTSSPAARATRTGSGPAPPRWSTASRRCPSSACPAMRVAFVPRDQVTFQGNWDVLGLRGTGELRLRARSGAGARGLHLPAARGHQAGEGVRSTTSGCSGSPRSGHAALRPRASVGGRWTRSWTVARSKQRLGAEPIADQQLFQHDFALHDAALRAARSYTFEAFTEAEATARADGRPVGHAGPADATGHHLRHPDGGRRGPLRLHLGRLDRATRPQRHPTLLPRPVRRHPAPLRRQQHAYGLHASRPGGLRRVPRSSCQGCDRAGIGRSAASRAYSRAPVGR